MYVVISTNRPWQVNFAYEQVCRLKEYLKHIKLIVLDNTKEGIDLWGNFADYHIHCPECKNVSQMFNHFVENFTGVYDHLIYTDDDIELSKDFALEVWTHLTSGYDRVITSKIYVTDLEADRTGVWYRKESQCGAPWAISADLFQATCEMTVKGRQPRFNPDINDGYVQYFRDLPSHNTKYIFSDCCNAILHGKNTTMKPHKKMHFEFNMERVRLD